MGKVFWTQWQGLEDGVLKSWQAALLLNFLGNLKDIRENLWHKDNCLAIEENPNSSKLWNDVQLHQIHKEIEKGSERLISRVFRALPVPLKFGVELILVFQTNKCEKSSEKSIHYLLSWQHLTVDERERFVLTETELAVREEGKELFPCSC